MKKHPPASSFRLKEGLLEVELGYHFWDAESRKDVFKRLEGLSLTKKIASLLGENRLNKTEGRSVTHTHWRDHKKNLHKTTTCIAKKIIEEGFITDVVNVGIGGSELGNKLCCTALKNYSQGKITPHFLSGPDPDALNDLFKHLDPKKTLWLFVSKSFLTLETLALFKMIKDWFLKNMPEEDFKNHFLAITSQVEKAKQYGFSEAQCLLFDEGVGGRFSLWSSVGFIIQLYIGLENYEALLSGAYAMDQHFSKEPIEKNIPVLLAWLDYFYAKFFQSTSRMVETYSERLHVLPSFLQQLEMESLGKSARYDGKINAQSLVVWGGVGPNGQHAFHQFLYQSQQLIPTEFLVVKKTKYFESLSKLQFVECLGQMKALWDGTKEEKDPNKKVEGFKPSTLILLDELTPFSLGQLLAMYEHKVFVLAELYGINAFDQFGVELGKKMTQPLLDQFKDKNIDDYL